METPKGTQKAKRGKGDTKTTKSETEDHEPRNQGPKRKEKDLLLL